MADKNQRPISVRLLVVAILSLGFLYWVSYQTHTPYAHYGDDMEMHDNGHSNDAHGHDDGHGHGHDDDHGHGH
jgi:hypothetical protein